MHLTSSGQRRLRSIWGRHYIPHGHANLPHFIQLPHRSHQMYGTDARSSRYAQVTGAPDLSTLLELHLLPSLDLACRARSPLFSFLSLSFALSPYLLKHTWKAGASNLHCLAGVPCLELTRESYSLLKTYNLQPFYRSTSTTTIYCSYLHHTTCCRPV